MSLKRHEGQWSGTRRPSLWLRLVLRSSFWAGMMAATLLLSPSDGESSELRALNGVLSWCKGVHSADLARIRTPFLGVVTPEPAHFAFGLRHVDGMDVYTINATNTGDTTLLYIHGGGFVSGDFGGFRCFVHELSERANLPLLFPHYRLTPEHDLADQVDDVVTMIGHAQQRANRVIVVGDSAGGGLILMALQRIARGGVVAAMPDRAILVSPVTDLACDSDSHRRNGSTCMFEHAVVEACMRVVCKDKPPQTLSPLHQDLTGLCPLYLMASTAEIFADDTKRLATKAAQQNVKTTVVLRDKVPHAYPLFYFVAPECDAGLDQIVDWCHIQT